MIRHPAPLLLAAALAASTLLACTDEAPKPAATAAATPLATASGTVEPATPTIAVEQPSTSSGSPSPTPVMSASGKPAGGPGTVVIRFPDPGPPLPVINRDLTGEGSPFATRAHASADVVLYDMQTMTERVIGSGIQPSFNQTGTRIAWRNGRDVTVFTLSSGATQTLTMSELFTWLDERSIVDMARREVLDVVTGARRPVTAAECGDEPYRCARGNDAARMVGSVLLENILPNGMLATPTSSSSTFRVTVPGVAGVIEFDALRVVPAPDGMLAVLTLPAPRSPRSSRNGRVDWVTTSLFLVDPRAAKASFIATAQMSELGYILLAGRDHVVWRERICGPEPGVTKIYDRRSGVLTEVRSGLEWPSTITPGGLVASGPYTPTVLVAPDTLVVRPGLPAGVSSADWSPDYRYAVAGQQFGRDGTCY